MSKRILHVVSNVSHFGDPTYPTGLWLSDLTHAYDVFEAKGYQQRIISPKGGVSPLEPRSLKWPLLDASQRLGSATRVEWRYWHRRRRQMKSIPSTTM